MTAVAVCHLGLCFCIQTFIHFTLPHGKIDCATLRNVIHKMSNSLGVAYLCVAIVTLVSSYVSTCHNIEYFTMCHHGHHIPISHHVCHHGHHVSLYLTMLLYVSVSPCVTMVTMYHCISQCCCMSVCHYMSPCVIMVSFLVTMYHCISQCCCMSVCHHVPQCHQT